MSQTTSRERYADVFLTCHPKDGLHSVQERQKQGNTLDDEFTQYFKERALIEDQYAKSLVKASKRIYVMDSNALGGFTPIWELLLNELTEISTAHGVLAYQITEEIEKPLKIPASTDLDQIKALEPSYQQLAKDYESSLKTKKSLFKSASKQQQQQPDNLLSKWSSEGSYFLQLYENMERARLFRLKSLVEKFEKLHKEQLLKRMEVADTTLAAANCFDVDNEIRTFCKVKSTQLTTMPPSTAAPELSDSDSTGNPHSSNSTPNNDIPRSITEKKSRSRFSILRKSRKPSSVHSKKDHHRISSIPEFIGEQDQPADNKKGGSEPLSTNGVISPPKNQESSTPVSTPPPNTVTTTTTERAVTSSSSSPTTPVTPNLENISSQPPPVDDDGYSIPQPDRFGQGPFSLDEQADQDSMVTWGSQKLKFDIKDKTATNDDHQAAKENATLSRVSSLLRETTPGASQRRRGRRQNTRGQSVLFDSGPPSPLSSVHEHAAIQTGSTISNTSDSVTNPFRQTTPISEHTNFISSASPSPTSSLGTFPSYLLPRSMSSSSSHQPTLRTSIVETVDVRPGHMAAQVTGQIKMIYDGPSLRSDALLIVRLDQIEDIQPINSFVQPLSTEQNEGGKMFTVSIQAFEGTSHGAFVPLFNYRQESNIESVLPITVDPAWKVSNTSVMLMVKYRLTDRMPALNQGRMVVVVNLQQGNIAKVQSTPEGVWNQQQQIFTWKTMEILQHEKEILSKDGSKQPHRLLAKFTMDSDQTTNAESEPVKRYISLRYYCRDTLVSNIELKSWVQGTESAYSPKVGNANPNKLPGDSNQELKIQLDQCMVKSGSIFFT